jgi:signal transduction histidine kinase
MVMDILYYAKDREPQWENIPIKDLMEEVCENFSDRAKRNNIDYICEIDPNVEKLEADRNALRSLLINLLDNSLDACRIDTKKKIHTVTLKVDHHSDQIVFNVSDNGIGMDRETREKAFSMFFSSKGAGGTGLGLFIANKIAESHGGSIKIESEEGKGSEFTVKMLKKRPD